jgi:predicted PurR-regulated permease PerM
VVGLGIIAVLGTFVWLVGPQVSTQFDELLQRLPSALDQLEHNLQRYTWGQYVLQHMTASKGGVSLGVNVFTRVTGLASTVLTTLADLLLIPFTGIFLAVNPDVYIRGLLLLIPQRQVARVHAALNSAGQELWQWLMGQLIAMFFVGLFVTGGLLLLGVPLALVLGLIAGLLNFVSFLGAIVSALPGILLALTLGPMQALYAALVYVLAQHIEGYLVTPLVQQQAVALPPALVILAVVAFGMLLGLPGVILATPLAVVVMGLVNMLYVEDILGKKG